MLWMFKQATMEMGKGFLFNTLQDQNWAFTIHIDLDGWLWVSFTTFLVIHQFSFAAHHFSTYLVTTAFIFCSLKEQRPYHHSSKFQHHYKGWEKNFVRKVVYPVPFCYAMRIWKLGALSPACSGYCLGLLLFLSNLKKRYRPIQIDRR